jgi:hypothetical protein
MPAEERNEEVSSQQDHSFDELAKGLASGTLSRRGALRLVGASLLGVLLGGLPMRLVGAQTTNCPYNYAQCGSGRYCCNGSCVDLNTSNSNCGYCGNACPSGQTCQGGVCLGEGGCPSGYTSCGGRCTDTRYDNQNCGRCGNVCPANASCQNGVCTGGACPSGQQRCTTSTTTYCADLQTDENNCGECGNVCPDDQECVGGQCECPSGTTECGGQCVSNECPSGEEFNPDTCMCEAVGCTAGTSCTGPSGTDSCGPNPNITCRCRTLADGSGTYCGCAAFPAHSCDECSEFNTVCVTSGTTGFEFTCVSQCL